MLGGHRDQMNTHEKNLVQYTAKKIHYQTMFSGLNEQMKDLTKLCEAYDNGQTGPKRKA